MSEPSVTFKSRILSRTDQSKQGKAVGMAEQFHTHGVQHGCLQCSIRWRSILTQGRGVIRYLTNNSHSRIHCVDGEGWGDHDGRGRTGVGCTSTTVHRLMFWQVQSCKYFIKTREQVQWRIFGLVWHCRWDGSWEGRWSLLFTVWLWSNFCLQHFDQKMGSSFKPSTSLASKAKFYKLCNM